MGTQAIHVAETPRRIEASHEQAQARVLRSDPPEHRGHRPDHTGTARAIRSKPACPKLTVELRKDRHFHALQHTRRRRRK
jgi:hypothetical protein